MSTLLSYTFLPNAVFVNTNDDLVLVIENPVDKSPVKFTSGRGGDLISVEFLKGDSETDLVTDLNFNAKITPDTFSVGINFDITANQDVTLNPGESIRVTFKNVPINNVSGESEVTIKEYIGSSSEKASIPITKKKQELGVIVWLDPMVVGRNHESTLQFKSSSSTKVVISGYPDGKGEKSFETPPYSNSDQVGIGSETQSQRTYTATAWAGGNQSPPEPVTLTQVPPLITVFTPTPGGGKEVAPSAQVSIEWSEMFGDDSSMKWLESLQNNVTSPFSSVPGTELTKTYNPSKHNAEFMPGSVTYTLVVEGFEEPARQGVTFKVKPVQLNYLKYEKYNESDTPSLSGIKFSYDPSDWGAVSRKFGNNALALTIYQPGYTQDVFYLNTDDKDTVNPMIQYFEVNDDNNLFWVTKNLESLTLNPGGISIDADSIAKGTHAIPQGATEVNLIGTAKNGSTIRSVLKVS